MCFPLHLGGQNKKQPGYTKLDERTVNYCVARSSGGEKHWRNFSTCVFGWEKFGELSKSSITYQSIDNIWLGLLWRINGQSPNSPMYSPANVLRYMIAKLCTLAPFQIVLFCFFMLNTILAMYVLLIKTLGQTAIQEH